MSFRLSSSFVYLIYIGHFRCYKRPCVTFNGYMLAFFAYFITILLQLDHHKNSLRYWCNITWKIGKAPPHYINTNNTIHLFGYNKNNVASVVSLPVATIIYLSGQGRLTLINSQKFSRFTNSSSQGNNRT